SWTIQACVFAFLATAVVLLLGGGKDQLLAIFSFFGVVGWVAGAIAYFCLSVLYSHQRKGKQRAVTWLPLGASVASLAGVIWWFHYTVRFDVALTAAALIGPMPPAPMVAPAPVTSAEPVAPAPVTPVAPALNPNFTCTRIGNVTICK